MSSVLQSLPVAGAVVVALFVSVVFTKSLLHLMFGALGRLVTSHQADAAAE
ncbi:MAG: hypothetical protein ACE5IK_13485 [Acidobacteriota bacterium]